MMNTMEDAGRQPAAPGPSSDDTLRAEAFRGPAGLARIADDWEQVASRQFRQRFFHWRNWHHACVEHLAPDPDEVWFFLLRRGVTPIAVVPLEYAETRLLGKRLRRWRLFRHAHVPLADIVAAAGCGLSELREALLPAIRRHAGGWDVLEFSRLLDESALVADPAACAAAGGVLSVDKTCDQVECTGSFDDINARFSKNFRSNLNKARNKLKRHDDVRVTSISMQPQLQPAFEEFLALEASGWKGPDGAGTAIELHNDLVGFYQAIVDGVKGNVVINSLYLDGKVIAAQFCVRDRDTLYILKLAYDESHSRLAPGNMLLERVIRRGIEQGEWRYVNLVGNPEWFRAWAPDSQDMLTLRLMNRTAGGLLFRLVLRAKARLAPAYRWFRENLANRRERRR